MGAAFEGGAHENGELHGRLHWRHNAEEIGIGMGKEKPTAFLRQPYAYVLFVQSLQNSQREFWVEFDAFRFQK